MRWILLFLLAACGSEPRQRIPVTGCKAGWDRTVLVTTPPEEHRFEAAGLAAADLDGDGRVDLLAPGPDRVYLWWHTEDGWVEDLSLPAGLGEHGVGASVADLDGDGDPDVYLSRYGLPDVLLRNDDGSLADATSELGLGDVADRSQSSAWADLDRDGWLDLVVAGRGEPTIDDETIVLDQPADPTRIWRGGPDGFTEATGWLPQRVQDAYTFAVGVVDLDGDPWPDLYFANDYPGPAVPSLAVRGGPEGFSETAAPGLEQSAVAGMGLGAADVNGDGLDDLLLSDWDRVAFLGSQPDAGVWVAADQPAGFDLPAHDQAWVGWGADWADLDNDGDLDGLVGFGHLDTLTTLHAGGQTAANAEEQPDQVYEKVADGAWRRVQWGLDDRGPTRGFVVTDLDGDGTLDVVKRTLDGEVIVHTGTCVMGGWLSVRLHDEGPNRDAVGARIAVEPLGLVRTVRAGGRSLASGGPVETHIGVGDLQQVDLQITWPDGTQTDHPDVSVGQRVVLTR